MLQAYGKSYHYDPAHWSFLTGPADKIAELARGAGVTYESDHGTINHNFRTLIINADGRLQMVFPTSGDFPDQIVAEIIRAAVVTNEPAPPGSQTERASKTETLSFQTRSLTVGQQPGIALPDSSGGN
jgi:hypothetical protein